MTKELCGLWSRKSGVCNRPAQYKIVISGDTYYRCAEHLEQIKAAANAHHYKIVITEIRER